MSLRTAARLCIAVAFALASPIVTSADAVTPLPIAWTQ